MKLRRNLQIILCAFTAVLLLGTAVFGMSASSMAAPAGRIPVSNDGDTPSDIPSNVAAAVLDGGPQIGAANAIVMEVNSGAVLYSKNATASCSPMSLTKLVTGLLAFENLSTADTVSFSYKAINGIGSSVTRVGIVENERISVLDALYAMLIASADEVSYALGEKMSNNKINNFYQMMNDRVKALGGVNSSFSSATGTGGSKQTSCAYDLALVACELYQYPLFRQIASASWYEIPATNLKESRVLAQTHKFIRKNAKKYEYAIAGKSGGQAADKTYSLCTYAEREGLRVVAIVLGSANSDSSYDDTISIVNYVFENYKANSMRSIESSLNEDYTGLFDYCPMFDDGQRDLIYIDRNSTIVLPRSADPSSLVKTIEYSLPSEYVHGENIIGHVIYRFNGHRVGNAGIIYYNQEYPLSQAEFDAVWPFFLIPPTMLPSQGGSGVVIDNSYLTANITPAPTPVPGKATPTPAPTPASSSLIIEKEPEEPTGLFSSLSIRTRAWLLGGAIFFATFLPCVILIFVVLPRRARKRNRVTKRL